MTPQYKQTLRGKGSDVVIVDEMAYVPKKPFAEVVLPIMVKKGSIMIGISTYGEPTNFFTKLLNYRAPDGSRMFRQIEYTTICKKCLAKGVKEVCKHRRGELPHWHDAGEYAQIFEMLKDDPDIAMKELGGVSVDSSVRPFFNAQRIQEIQSGVNTESGRSYTIDLKNAHQDTVFITVDPAGGGIYSEYAILSAVYTMDKMIVSFTLSPFSFFFLFPPFHLSTFPPFPILLAMCFPFVQFDHMRLGDAKSLQRPSGGQNHFDKVIDTLFLDH